VSVTYTLTDGSERAYGAGTERDANDEMDDFTVRRACPNCTGGCRASREKRVGRQAPAVVDCRHNRDEGTASRDGGGDCRRQPQSSRRVAYDHQRASTRHELQDAVTRRESKEIGLPETTKNRALRDETRYAQAVEAGHQSRPATRNQHRRQSGRRAVLGQAGGTTLRRRK